MHAHVPVLYRTIEKERVQCLGDSRHAHTLHTTIVQGREATEAPFPRLMTMTRQKTRLQGTTTEQGREATEAPCPQLMTMTRQKTRLQGTTTEQGWEATECLHAKVLKMTAPH